jgi:two-component system, response regulator PdtaR
MNDPGGKEVPMVPEPISNHVPAHILVIEDDELIRMMVADELRTTGFVVAEADSADVAKSYLDSGNQVDLIFSDVRMPGSLDGLDLARLVHVRCPTLPIILASGYVGSDDIGDVGQFLPKPYDVDRAVSLIRSTLGLLQT